ncbi:hypothetical protein Pmar_PMAR012017 [Perkinsus marinus ATCC 50983]|uniref:Uncharacterized protein n=1 Tax=Perkinsus marinus (strain ATCC 50983 / TXsc) TaxID=423536 RepID=C5LW72_PERM5|nr:hypothetical protein Pmar_PMAR012017 [Perkinsus marinus ATCC 50983]EEQ99009.1 hypothetical protein Pmar_PMAR012017 [Perkinsus marinus ATCC 50983]|eukprot:XP_002766292.1 hypothetical protein Pmar_PMAR012017 [Perkinsus marinus ATCC 50983]
MIRIHEPGFGVSFGYAADIIIGEKNEMVLIMMDVLTDGSVDFAILREVKNPVQELADYYDDEGQVEKTEM